MTLRRSALLTLIGQSLLALLAFAPHLFLPTSATRPEAVFDRVLNAVALCGPLPFFFIVYSNPASLAITQGLRDASVGAAIVLGVENAQRAINTLGSIIVTTIQSPNVSEWQSDPLGQLRAVAATSIPTLATVSLILFWVAVYRAPEIAGCARSQEPVARAALVAIIACAVALLALIREVMSYPSEASRPFPIVPLLLRVTCLALMALFFVRARSGNKVANGASASEGAFADHTAEP